MNQPLSFILILSFLFTLPEFCLAQDLPTQKTSRNTSTGKEFEHEVKIALEKLGFEITEQTQVGTRPNGRKHLIDLIAKKNEKSSLISLKWQQSSGTAEQKVPYELICLSEALKQARGSHHSAYLVLGGEGWTLKKFYLSGGLDRHLNLEQPVKVLSLQSLLTLAKKGNL